jgi:hypothetical protein
VRRLDSNGSEYDLMLRFCECGNGISASINGSKFLDQLIT